MRKLIFLTVISLIGCGTLPRVDNLTFAQGEATEADYAKALEDCREFTEQAAKQRAQWIERRHIASSTLSIQGFPERLPPSAFSLGGIDSDSPELEYVRSRAMINCMESRSFLRAEIE